MREKLPDLDPQDDLSPDLEWMLQSGQADPKALVEALVRQCYSPVHRLALGLLDDTDAAAYTALEALVSTVANVYRYRGEVAAQSWVFRQASVVADKELKRLRRKRRLRALLPFGSDPGVFGETVPATEADAAIWLAVDSLDEKMRLPVLLRYLFDWDATAIAQFLDTREIEVAKRLKSARRHFAASLSQRGFSEDDLQPERLHPRLVASLQQRWPEPELSEADCSALVSEVEQQSARRSASGRRSASIKEMMLVLVFILVAGGTVMNLERFTSPPQATPAPQLASAAPAPPARPISAARAAAASRAASDLFQFYLMAREGDTLQRIARRIGIRPAAFSSLNSFAPDQPLQPGQPVRVVPNRGFAMTYLQPTSPPVPPVERLAEQPTHADIARFLSTSADRWSTLWGDALLMDYGPDAYRGPPVIRRYQVWVDQPFRSMQLEGGYDQPPEARLLNRGRLQYSYNYAIGRAIVNEDHGLLEGSPLHDLVFPEQAVFLSAGGKFDSPRWEQSFGRQALKVDFRDGSGARTHRLWIDAETGVLLRMQSFTGAVGETVRREVVFGYIDFKRDLPDNRLFDPTVRLDDFTVDARGAPERVPGLGVVEAILRNTDTARNRFEQQPEMPQADLGRARLTFQYPEISPFNSWEGNSGASRLPVEVFADHVYLGSLDLHTPWTLECTRSLDGRMLAFTDRLPFSTNPNRWQPPKLRWVSLEDLSKARSPVSEMTAQNLAFSPDGQKLAFAGFSLTLGPGVYIADVSTGQTQRLAGFDNAAGLTWSPEGEYLALTTWEPAAGQQAAVVVRVDDGEVIARQDRPWSRGQDPIDWDSHLPRDWPTRSWSTPFPAEAGGLERCALPAQSNFEETLVRVSE